ncbi:TonB family protein [Pseudoalteromonas rubra]|uniref:Energy transducer TonB n=1 Tax=Pseudoalteromonas rubra TaxID=43658 RepID=A0A5S3WY20_9GAMM|nr:TonB family protein [Pseudoalteromonas rubra]TMP35975.1 energy transducer TonB [Pseudoalteromonas rubra]
MIGLFLASTFVSFIDTETYRVESCIGEPFQLVEHVHPVWPLHTEHLEGVAFVHIRATVDNSGKLLGYHITDSKMSRIFSRASIRALKNWRFNESKYAQRCFDITFKFNSDKR